MRHILHRTGLVLFICVLFVMAGCGKNPGETVEGEVVLGATKFTEGDKIVVLLNNATNNYSGEVDEENKFKIQGLEKGTYKVRFIHYQIAAKTVKKGPPTSPNSPKAYPEDWSVPGGPYKLDLSKVKKQ